VRDRPLLPGLLGSGQACGRIRRSLVAPLRWRGVVRLCDVYLSTRRDTAAARSFFARALNTTKVAPVEVVTDKAAVYPTRP